MALFQRGNGAGQQPRSQCRNGTDRDPPKVARLERHQLFAHAAEFGEHHACVVDDGFTKWRGAHAPGQAFEKLDTEQILGLVQHLGRRRLGHADVVSGAPQRTEFLQRQHQPQLA
ncbi:hypothetical protein D3C87_1486370 [compost metagenome]